MDEMTDRLPHALEDDEGSGGALTMERMREEIAAMLFLNPAEIADDDDLLLLGLDSIRLMTLAMRWNDAGARLTFADFAERPVLRHWWEIVSHGYVEETDR